MLRRQMRRLAFTVLALAVWSLLTAFAPACSSSGAKAASDSADAAIPPNQLEGQPCDPTLTSPCYTGPQCFEVACVPGPDGGPSTCAETRATDACAPPTQPTGDDGGPETSSGTILCTSDLECPNGFSLDASAPMYVCAFPAFDGCNVTGICMIPSAPPRLVDGGVETACGCDGQPVSYVGDVWTSEPVASPSPCTKADAGVDAAADGAADSGSDSATDDAAADDAPSGD